MAPSSLLLLSLQAHRHPSCLPWAFVERLCKALGAQRALKREAKVMWCDEPLAEADAWIWYSWICMMWTVLRSVARLL